MSKTSTLGSNHWHLWLRHEYRGFTTVRAISHPHMEKAVRTFTGATSLTKLLKECTDDSSGRSQKKLEQHQKKTSVVSVKVRARDSTTWMRAGKHGLHGRVRGGNHCWQEQDGSPHKNTLNVADSKELYKEDWLSVKDSLATQHSSSYSEGGSRFQTPNACCHQVLSLTQNLFDNLKRVTDMHQKKPTKLPNNQVGNKYFYTAVCNNHEHVQTRLIRSANPCPRHLAGCSTVILVVYRKNNSNK